jgi:hypothetical protein
MYQNLPSWIKVPSVEDNKLSLRFKNGSQIKATTTNSDAGRSESLSMLVVDECVSGTTHIKVRNKKTGEIKHIQISELYNELKN